MFLYVMSFDIYGNYYYPYHSGQIPTDVNPDGYNYLRLANDQMDAAIEALGSQFGHRTN